MAFLLSAKYFLYFKGVQDKRKFRRRDIMKTIKGFWQHTNGKIYAVESDTFGKIVGGVEPLDPDDLYDLNDYDYKPAITGWLVEAVAQHKLHRINPILCR